MKRSSEDIHNISKKSKLDWNDQLETLKKYISDHNKLPSTRNKCISIVRLAKWYYQQKIKYDHLSKEYKEKWNVFMSEYYDKIKSNIVWEENLNKLKTYIDTFGKLPSQNDPTYKKLSKWLQNQKQRICMKDDHTKKLWEDFNKKYLLTNDEWYHKLDKLKSYIDIHLEVPLQTDENDENRMLSFWLSRQKKYYSTKNMKQEYMIKWEEFTNQYQEYLISKKEEWYIKLNVLKSYIDTHKEKPKQKVHHLGNWLYMQQQYYKLRKYSMKDDDIRKSWENFNEDYKQYLLINEIWMNKLKLVKEYININEKLPPKDSELSNWIKTQQKNHLNHRMKEDIHTQWKLFINDYHKYFRMKQYIWLNKLNEVKEFIDKHQYFPSPYHKIKNIRLLGQWINKQHDYYKNNQFKNQSIKDRWELFKSEYYTPETYWKNALDNVIQYMNFYKKIPSDTDPKSDIRGLAVWMNAQYNHYYKQYGAMKNENLRKLWEKFLHDHKDIIIFAK
jgi:hypothetical protein